MTSLLEALGYGSDQRVLVLSADLMGSTHAATEAGLISIQSGSATTATLMMPGPWARYGADRILHGPPSDVGVHLTLNAELENFRWGPLTQAPSLLDGDGGFPRTVADLWDHADIDEVRRECRAQLERASSWGLDITHLTTHMLALQQRPEFFDALLDVACQAQLPIRLESGQAGDDAGFPFRSLAAQEGVFTIDHFKLTRDGARQHFESTLASIAPGVTEIAFAPALAAEEQRAVDPHAVARIDDLELLTDRNLPARLDRLGIKRAGYREIRSAQRAAD